MTTQLKRTNDGKRFRTKRYDYKLAVLFLSHTNGTPELPNAELSLSEGYLRKEGQCGWRVIGITMCQDGKEAWAYALLERPE